MNSGPLSQRMACGHPRCATISSSTRVTRRLAYVRVDPALLRPAEVDYLCGDAKRAHAALGWRPRTTFEELIAMMVDSDLERNRQFPRTPHFVPGM